MTAEDGLIDASVLAAAAPEDVDETIVDVERGDVVTGRD